MKVNIYYGGRGLIDDPAIFAMNKVMTVLEELNIKVKKYNLYEDKRGISVLPKTLKEVDAVIIAASVEWMGIGGLLWQFLDACWLYGDKEMMSWGGFPVTESALMSATMWLLRLARNILT